MVRFRSFPVKASMLYLVQSKICKTAVFHPGRRLFSSKRRWFYFVSDNVQSSRQVILHKGRNPAAILKKFSLEKAPVSILTYLFRHNFNVPSLQYKTGAPVSQYTRARRLISVFLLDILNCNLF